jgi:hypothetical protein
LARMSDGHFCLLRDLGPVKGGKGLRHHEIVIDINRHGIVELFRRLINGKNTRDQHLPGTHEER